MWLWICPAQFFASAALLSSIIDSCVPFVCEGRRDDIDNLESGGRRGGNAGAGYGNDGIQSGGLLLPCCPCHLEMLYAVAI